MFYIPYLSSPLHSQLLSMPQILFTGYKVPHRLHPYFLIKIQTDGTITHQAILEQACTKLFRGTYRGMTKVTEDIKISYAATIRIVKQDHTLGNLLRAYVLGCHLHVLYPLFIITLTQLIGREPCLPLRQNSHEISHTRIFLKVMLGEPEDQLKIHMAVLEVPEAPHGEKRIKYNK